MGMDETFTTVKFVMTLFIAVSIDTNRPSRVGLGGERSHGLDIWRALILLPGPKYMRP